MEPSQYIDILEQEGNLLVAAAASAGLGAPVPSCPDWTVRNLLAHVGFVHRWATSYVAEGRMEMVPEPDEETLLKSAPPDDELLAWVQQGHSDLVKVLRSAPDDLKCWTFLPAPSPLSFWSRRQAHETAVHRVDAQLAAGANAGRLAAPLDPDFAADGADELLLGFLSRRRRYKGPGPGACGTIRFEDVATGTGWNVDISEDGLEPSKGPGRGDLTVRATPGELYLLLWNRRPLAGLDVSGRAELLDVWAKRARVTWS